MLPRNVQLQAHDCFDRQPFLGARAYYMRALLHGQSDENCVQILREVARAVATDSVLFIAENVMPRDPTARSRLTSHINLIMLYFGGKERTEVEFEALAETVGLEVVKVWRAEMSSMHSVVECRLRR